ncbi:hypothetical protein [Paraburkholderia dipogonis]|uniref:hypothetical protein n=1 Tax=Paraburkholderia dipogonis TaxID=1211383 RepID=UPI0038BADDD6
MTTKTDASPSKDRVTREQIKLWAMLAGIEHFTEHGLGRLGDFAIFARQDYAPASDVRAEATGGSEQRTVIRALEEPVTIEKAMLAGRLARVVLDKGVGPVAAVHLVNIGITGWVHTKETAEAYAKGFNTAAAWMQSALLAASSDDDEAEDFKANEIEFGSILIEQLCELPDRNSHRDEPDAMAATPAELRRCIERALEKYCFVISGAGEGEVQS